MEFIGSIDQGTQSTRFTLYNTRLEEVLHSTADHEQFYPSPGWCEHDPIEILKCTYGVINRTIKEAEALCTNFKILSIGITNQRETIVAWNKYTGTPLYNAIAWLDTRTASIVEDLIREHGGQNAFQHLTGLPISTYFSAVKIKWLLKNVPSVSLALQKNEVIFGTIDTWLIWNLTGGSCGGVLATDITNASRTLLFDINTCNWSPWLLGVFGINKSCLSPIYSNCETFGLINNDNLPLLSSVPITGCAGDQQASCIGQGLISKGDIKCTYGTGAFLLAHIGDTAIISNYGLITSPCYKLGQAHSVSWALEGSIANAGSVVSWLEHNLHVIHSAKETELLAKSVSDTEGLIFVPAFSGLFAPRWRKDARGGIFGLTQWHTTAHIVRATFESIAFMTLEVIEAMQQEMDVVSIPLIKVDGGMVKNSAFLQICADILGCTIEKNRSSEMTSLGAAIAAGIGYGIWPSLQAAQELIKSGSQHWFPALNADLKKQKLKQWNAGVERCLNWVQLSENSQDSSEKVISQ